MKWWSGRRSPPERLHTETYGAGEDTLVFIAGLGGTTRYWASRVTAMQDRYRIVLVDLLGFGESPKPWTRYSVERHVDALRDALADLGPLSLIGHSLGSLVTVAYAARYPKNVRHLVLMGLPYFACRKQAYRYFRSGRVRGGFVYTNVVLTMLVCLLTRRLMGRILPYFVRSVPREVAEDLVKHTWRSSTSSLWAVVYGYDIRNDFRRLPARMKVLFIHGREDLMAPVAAVERLVALWGRGQLYIFENVDHRPFLRDPSACLRLIDNLVGRASPAAVVPAATAQTYDKPST